MRHAVFGALVLLVCVPVSAAAWAVQPAIERAVQAPTRSAKFVKRDDARHPARELSFFGVTPHSTVVEIWPGGGYWTQILAPLLHDHGTYYVATGAPDGDHTERYFALSPAFQQMLAAHPQLYGRIKFTLFGAHHPGLAPPDSADVVLTFRNLHNWMAEGDAPQMIEAIHRALKPGGILGIEDHRARPDQPQDPKAADGYVRQDYAESLIEKAGFTLVASSEMNANPRDTTHWPHGVWTLPPTLAMGKTDRAKYVAIGEADNFVLKFRKTGD